MGWVIGKGESQETDIRDWKTSLWDVAKEDTLKTKEIEKESSVSIYTSQ